MYIENCSCQVSTLPNAVGVCPPPVCTQTLRNRSCTVITSRVLTPTTAPPFFKSRSCSSGCSHLRPRYLAPGTLSRGCMMSLHQRCTWIPLEAHSFTISMSVYIHSLHYHPLSPTVSGLPLCLISGSCQSAHVRAHCTYSWWLCRQSWMPAMVGYCGSTALSSIALQAQVATPSSQCLPKNMDKTAMAAAAVRRGS